MARCASMRSQASSEAKAQRGTGDAASGGDDVSTASRPASSVALARKVLDAVTRASMVAAIRCMPHAVQAVRTCYFAWTPTCTLRRL